ncbi:MAG: hypothetical protein IH911_04330 [Proteobacteria bacterium]|nr:hypothetical protein [Pseudomonadota bacterium]
MLLHAHGIMINVPAPGRFALHKCVVSQTRAAAFATRSRKDLLQAEQVFQVLLDNRPGDLSLAFDAARATGDAFVGDFLAGLNLIGKDIRKAVQSQLDIH